MQRLRLFEAYGIELEYMIVDRDSLVVKPIADELLKHELGEYGSDFENGIVSWSNELVLHVIELKSTRPESDLQTLEKKFAENVVRVNKVLEQWNAILMPTAAHPFMDPLVEAKLWPHDNNEVYEVYNRIFDCRGHGWSNVQSTHLNLPFQGDEEFAKLHAAIRLVLPILPALCASSPVINHTITGSHDTRLVYYKNNQKKIPSITASVIPEAVFTKADYEKDIYDRIKQDIAQFDPEKILDPVWVNSRGAISRFDRGSIEIRLMDVQECPAADVALVTLVVETLKSLVREDFATTIQQRKWSQGPLLEILALCIEKGEHALITDTDYLNMFTVNTNRMTAGELWSHIFQKLNSDQNAALKPVKNLIEVILKKGTLSTRIIQALKGNSAPDALIEIYKAMINSLCQNTVFIP